MSSLVPSQRARRVPRRFPQSSVQPHNAVSTTTLALNGVGLASTDFLKGRPWRGGL